MCSTHCFLTLDEAREQIAKFIRYYNEERLHSAIGYVAPKVKLKGWDKQILTERNQKLEAAREARKNDWQKNNSPYRAPHSCGQEKH